MKKGLLVATVVMVAVGAMSTAAFADVGDIDDATLVGSGLESDDDELTVEGEVTCEEDDLQYGVIVKATQGNNEVGFDRGTARLRGAGQDNRPEADPTDNSATEATGAFGPAFEGVQDDQSCDENGQNFDVTVQANGQSAEFSGGQDVDIEALISTSANSGANGPGPIIGDFEIIARSDAQIEGGGNGLEG